MTLARLVLAWLPVAGWFAAAGWVAHRLIGSAASPPATAGTLAWTAGEALLVTLFGSLWFDSLGHGGWWLLFGLVGMLAAGLPARPGVVALAVSTLRYVGAGALLAWGLG
ncbi:MAG: hypothetical protein ACREMF_11385 [Gemmatimonadales bacterium]